MKHIKAGQDFDFPADFGFTGSAMGRHDAKNHPTTRDNEGRGEAHTEKRGGGHPRGYADGGEIIPGRSPANPNPNITLPAAQAAKAAQALVAAGRQQGATAAVRDLASAARARRAGPSVMGGPGAMMSPAAQPPGPVAGTEIPPNMGGAAMMPGMKKGGPVRRAMGGPAMPNPMSTQPQPAMNPMSQAQPMPMPMGAPPMGSPPGNMPPRIGGALPPAPQGIGQPGSSMPPRIGGALPPASQGMGPAQMQSTAMAKGGRMTAKQRHSLPAKDFALPGERYPINDAAHARNALARVAQHGSPQEKATVGRKVHGKFPDIGKRKDY